MHGVDRFAARKKIVARLEEQGLVEKIEPQTHVVPYGDRSNAVIEPYLTDQWYVNAKNLAKPAIEAVRRAKLISFPKTGRRSISTGWKISSPGAFRASFGGGIKFRRGMGLTANRSSH